MKRWFRTTTVCCAVVFFISPVCAQQKGGIQMLPPTPLGSTTACPSGTQQVLSYSGTPMGGGQGGINCVPIATDAQGNMAAAGFVQVGPTTTPCSAARAGSIRFNQATLAFEGCNGTDWQALGGGSGATLVVGGCQLYWSACPSGYRATSYFSPGAYGCCDRCWNPSWRYTVCSQ